MKKFLKKSILSFLFFLKYLIPVHADIHSVQEIYIEWFNEKFPFGCIQKKLDEEKKNNILNKLENYVTVNKANDQSIVFLINTIIDNYNKNQGKKGKKEVLFSKKNNGSSLNEFEMNTDNPSSSYVFLEEEIEINADTLIILVSLLEKQFSDKEFLMMLDEDYCENAEDLLAREILNEIFPPTDDSEKKKQLNEESLKKHLELMMHKLFRHNKEEIQKEKKSCIKELEEKHENFLEKIIACYREQLEMLKSVHKEEELKREALRQEQLEMLKSVHKEEELKREALRQEQEAIRQKLEGDVIKAKDEHIKHLLIQEENRAKKAEEDKKAKEAEENKSSCSIM